MKAAIGISIILITGFTGCKDISEVGSDEDKNSEYSSNELPVESEPSSKPNPARSKTNTLPVSNSPATVKGSPPPKSTYKKYFYPFSRTLTDAKSRTIDAEILAKSGNEIAFRKTIGATEYIVPLSMFSQADQNFINSKLDDGGGIEKIRTRIDKKKRLKGRVANWHRDLEQAQKESESLGIPMFVLISVVDHKRSTELQKIFSSTEFRAWANQNVSLLLLTVDNPKTRKTSSMSAKVNRKEAGKLGISRFSNPLMLMVRDTEKYDVSHSNVSDTGSAIMHLQKICETENGWQPYYPAYNR